jgi:hypothetical protein
MPEERIVKKAKHDLKEGKSPSTAAGEFVHEEIEHVREGKHGARSAKQAVAIGLSKARRAGIPVKASAAGKTSPATRKKAAKAHDTGQSSPRSHAESSATRSKAGSTAMKREPTSSAGHAALSRQAKSAAKQRG